MKSVAILAILFPILIPIWQKTPLNVENTKVPEYPLYLDDDKIAVQKKFFQELKDPRLRSRVAITISHSNNPNGLKTLESLLATEKNTSVIGDLLAGCYRLREAAPFGNTALLTKYFKSDEPVIRAYSQALYLRKKKDTGKILKQLVDEDKDFVAAMLVEELLLLKDKCARQNIVPLLKSDSALKRSLAVQLLAESSSAPDKDAELLKAVQDDDVLVRMKLAKGLVARKSGGTTLLGKLANDKSTTVRGLVAGAPATDAREEIFLALTEDRDWDARRLACENLGNYRDKKAVETLIKHLGDSRFEVRTASENSLAKIKPGPEAIAKITELLDSDSGRHAAIRTLGLLGVKQASGKIFELLKTHKDDEELVYRAAMALGDLDYKPAAKEIASLAQNQSERVICACARTLGILNNPETYSVIESIASGYEKKVKPALEAVRAMGITKNKHFAGHLSGVAKNVKETMPADMRAAACWSIARVNVDDKNTVRQLKRLVVDKVISVMGERMYDSDQVRISAILALIDMKRDEDAKYVLHRVMYPAAGAMDVSGPVLREWCRQAELYMQGKEIKPIPVLTREPIKIITKLDDN